MDDPVVPTSLGKVLNEVARMSGEGKGQPRNAQGEEPESKEAAEAEGRPGQIFERSPNRDLIRAHRRLSSIEEGKHDHQDDDERQYHLAQRPVGLQRNGREEGCDPKAEQEEAKGDI